MPSTARLPLALAAAAFAALAACAPRAARPPAESPFDPARVRAEVAWLADPARAGRGTGTAGGQAGAAWIAGRLAETGLRPAFDPGYLQTFEARGAVTANVVAALPGRDPAVAGHCVVVGAHYDHLGLGGEGSLSPELVGTVYPGANDNASGVAALLAIARAMAAEGPARRAVVFAAFGAEELQLLGSAWLVGHPPPGCPVEATQLMVNLDTVGRPQAGKVYVDGTPSARGLRELVEAAASGPPRLPLTLVLGAVPGGSDQASFLARGVPAIFLFTGADQDYHRPTDIPEKLDDAGLASIACLAARIVRAAADGAPLEPVKAAPPPPRPQAERDHGYGAYLGAIPDFAERKEPGVLLTGVRPGSPAEQAGIAGGDVLLRVGETRLGSLRDLASALRAQRPGDEVEVEWEHGGSRQVAKVRLGERK